MADAAARISGARCGRGSAPAPAEAAAKRASIRGAPRLARPPGAAYEKARRDWRSFGSEREPKRRPLNPKRLPPHLGLCTLTLPALAHAPGSEPLLEPESGVAVRATRTRPPPLPLPPRAHQAEALQRLKALARETIGEVQEAFGLPSLADMLDRMASTMLERLIAHKGADLLASSEDLGGMDLVSDEFARYAPAHSSLLPLVGEAGVADAANR
ncbi:hypothetical protein T492DRAFT_902838 [Pavlovales sp. CCMP2436]|nr:hypothetical protein T492DRAFT_902838 [Pavlovales sp. CCMP2436]